MNKEQALYDYLIKHHVGENNAVHSRKLEKHFDICPRTVRSYINKLRKSGYPVCSNDTGYWIAANPDEVNKTVKRLGNFAGEVNSVTTGLAFANIQMRNVTKITEESIHITIKVS